jgi:hypothetical protein
LLWESVVAPGDPIPVQHFQRKEDERIIVRMLGGIDQLSEWKKYEEVPFGSARGSTAPSGQPEHAGGNVFTHTEE